MEGQQLIVIFHQGWTRKRIYYELAHNWVNTIEHIPKRNSDQSDIKGFGSLVHPPLDVTRDSAGTFWQERVVSTKVEQY